MSGPRANHNPQRTSETAPPPPGPMHRVGPWDLSGHPIENREQATTIGLMGAGKAIPAGHACRANGPIGLTKRTGLMERIGR